MIRRSRSSPVGVVLGLALAAGCAAADNAVFNGGFELGLAGWDCVRLLRHPANAQLAFTAPVIEEAGAVSGRRCVRLPNAAGEAIEFYAREVRLKRSTAYTVSVSLKSSLADTPVHVGFRAIVPPEIWKGIDANWTAGTEWQRFTHSFTTTGDQQETYSLYLRTRWEGKHPAADVWIDDLQVVEGGDQPFQASAAVEVAAVAVQPLCIGEAGALRAPATIAVANYGPTPVSGTVQLRLVGDDDGGAPLEVGSLRVEVPAGETRQFAHEVRVPRYGAFDLQPVAQLDAKASTFAGELTAIGRHVRKPVDLDTDFCVGANVGIGLEGGSFRARNGGAEEYAALLEAMGCRVARVFDIGRSFDLRVFEAVEGKPDWSLPDLLFGLYAKHGITPYPVVGESILADGDGRGGWPAWLVARCKKVPAFDGKSVFLPPMEDWRRYVRSLAEHFKGRMRHFEIMNEPNLYLKPAVYVPYLQAAYEELKQVDARNQVLGFCSTGDLGGQLGAFIEGCFALGAVQSADVISFHPYDSRDLSSPVPADRQIAAIRAMAAKAGRPDMKLWVSELYYLNFEKHAHANGPEVSRIVRPRHAARRFLTDLGEGMVQSTPAHQYSLWRPTLNPGFDHATWTTRWVPSGTFVAYNALARHFEGAKPLARHAWGSDTVCYVYERAGKTLAACWSYGLADNLSVKLPESGLRVLDTLGNPLPAGPVRLGASPTYLLYEGRDRAAFAAALAGAKVEVPCSVEVTSARLVTAGEVRAVSVTVRNLTAKELQIAAGVRTLAVSSPGSAMARLPASGEAVLTVPVTVTGTAPARLPLRIFANGRIWEIEAALTPATGQVAAPADLLANGGFEQDLTGWSVQSGGKAFSSSIVADPDFLAGAKTLRLDRQKPDPGEANLRLEGVPIAPGGSYTLTFWAKATADMSISAGLDAWNEPHAGGHFYRIEDFRIGREWRPYSLPIRFSSDLKAYPDLKAGKAALRVILAKNELGTLLLDDIRITTP